MSKRNFFFIAAIALPLFFSCEKEPSPTEDGNVVTIKASLENGRNWNDGDVVLINGADYKISEAGSPNTNISNVSKSAEYIAAYDFGKGTISDKILSFELPNVITSDNRIAPMVAFSENDNLAFKHLLGYLKMSISGSTTITKITLNSINPDSRLSGPATSDIYTNGAPAIMMSENANADITVDLGANGLDLSKGKQEISIPLPPSRYEDGFRLLIYDKDGKAMEKLLDFPIDAKRAEEKVLPEFEYSPGSEAPFNMQCTMENGTSGSPIMWEKGDKICVNGMVYQITSGEGTQQATFGPVIRHDFYAVVYPANANYGFSENFIKVNIPGTQYYGTDAEKLIPKVSYSTEESAELRATAGLVSVKVSGSNIIRSIQLSSKDKTKSISGKMDVNFSGQEFTTAMDNGGKPSITLECTEGVSTESGKEFTFVVPAGEYPQGFKVILTNNRNQIQVVETAGITVNRNQKTKLNDISWTPSAADSGDLSVFGWANCYVVSSEGKYSFDTKLVDGTSIKNISKVDWLWANSIKGNANTLISNISYSNGKVTFNASAQEGNVLLAAFNSNNEIVWSWHIWLTDEPKTINAMNLSIKDPSLGYFFMDRNLGATSAKATDGEETFGLFYQWGRKDPFYGGTESEVTSKDGVVTNKEPFKNAKTGTVCNTKYPQAKWQSEEGTKQNGTVDFAIKNPMFFLAGNNTASDNNWLEIDQPQRKNYDKGQALWRPFEKTNYDPCPVGYQVPRNGVYNVLEREGKWAEDWSGFIYTNSDSGETSWFPAQGFRSAHPQENGSLINVNEGEGSMIGIWYSEQMTANPNCRANSVQIAAAFIYGAADDAWGYGNNVRCVKTYDR